MSLLPIDRDDLKALLEFAAQHDALDEIRSRYSVVDAQQADAESVPVTPDGDIAVDEVCLNIGDVFIRFLDGDGKPLQPGQPACSHLVEVRIPGVDPRRILSVEFSDVDYTVEDFFLLKVGLIPFVPELHINREAAIS